METIINYTNIRLKSDKHYKLEIDNYQENDILKLRSNMFRPNGIRIFGFIKNTKTKIKFSDIVFKNFIFENCEFDDEFLGLDGVEFINCKFKNVKINSDFRWVDYINCEFDNVEINAKYSRRPLFRKNCDYKSLKYKSEREDDNFWVNGKIHKHSMGGVKFEIINNKVKWKQ